MTVTFCGHSDFVPSTAIEACLLSVLESQIGDSPAELLLGGYGNFDRFALRCGKIFQQTHPQVSLIYVTPYMVTERQTSVGAEYDGIVYPPLERIPPRYAILHRNRYMVERADLVIACITRSRGGAYQTYLHARRKGKTMINLADS